MSVPHTSGDEPCSGIFHGFGSDVFPTPAGMNRAQLQLGQQSTRVPHTSGDEPLSAFRGLNFLLVFPTPAGMNRT